MNNGEVLMGNGAVARGLIEGGCHGVFGYPGTPSSEIIPEAVRFKKMYGLPTYIEWSVNEKVAFESALAFAWSGKRAAVVMKQVGLNVASDPMMSAAYTGTAGGSNAPIIQNQAARRTSSAPAGGMAGTLPRQDIAHLPVQSIRLRRPAWPPQRRLRSSSR